ncbi:MAG: class I SAM-dependent methyltransferase [Candidatus Brocadia sp.]|jgi:ubiquinone/menaquinone biosynthesis C-methylase UbiE
MTNPYIIRGCKAFFFFSAILCLCVGAYAKEEIKRERPSKPFSPLKIPLLEDPERDTWQKPDEVLNALEIGKDQTVADIGAGSGYLTVKLSERVGSTGTVYAVDIQQEMLDYISKRLNDRRLKNVILLLGDMNDPKLPPGSLDIAIFLSTYHEIAQPVDFMKKIKQALKPHGRIAILEFCDESPVGPPVKFRLPDEIVIEELKQAGFTLLQRHTFLLPYQYFLVFTPSS